MFQLDLTKIQWPPPDSFEAGILRITEVPFQEMDVSGGQYPPVRPVEEVSLPPLRLDFEQVGPIRLVLGKDVQIRLEREKDTP